MIKVEVIKNFRYGEFDKIKATLKRGTVKAEEGWLYTTDTFECDKKAADYLLGDNPIKEPVVKIVEVEPEIIPIPNAKPEEVEIIPIPNAKIEDVKIMPVKSTKKKKLSKK